MNKEKIGLIQAMRMCARYLKMNEEKRLALRSTRLERMVAWARENSPYYARLYRDLPDAFTLSDLPPVNKVDLMANWDEWVTDRQITLSKVNEFMQTLDNIGRKLNGSYLVFTTSGSTGNPLVALCDHTTNNVTGAVNADWLIVEPVDQNNQPVPAGVLADKLLLTNLFNFTHGLTNIQVTLSKELPRQDALSGKFKHIVHKA